MRTTLQLVQRPAAWAALSGWLCSLAFPDWGFSPLSLVGLIPLLVAVQRCVRFRAAAGAGFLWGVAFFSVIISWIPQVMMRYGQLDAATAWLVHAALVCLMALFPAVACVALWIGQASTPRLSWLLAPCAWVAVEWLRTLVPAGGFPWGQLGYAMTPHLGFMQVASVTGIYGATFLVVLCNALVAARWQRPPVVTEPAFRAATAAFVLCWLAGFVGYQLSGSPEAGEPVRATVIQGDIRFERDLSEAARILDNFYFPATRQAFQAGARLVVWPESPTPHQFFSHEAYRNRIETLTREGNGALIFNDITEELEQGRVRYFNSALVVGESGNLVGRYDKVHLVPFGEYLPYADLLGFARALTREVSGFSAGQGPVAAPLQPGSAGIFICFEAIFPGFIRQVSRAGGDWLVNLTNDAWFGPTGAPAQHLQMAVVRAIENRRYLIRAANSGISAFISPRGEILQRSELFTRQVLSGEVWVRRQESWYARLGDFAAWGCAIITLVWIASCLRGAVRGRDRRQGAAAGHLNEAGEA